MNIIKEGENMATAVMKGDATMESKRVSISSKRQITIPQKYFAMLGFDSEAECILKGNELIIRPVKTTSSGEFDEYILADLIKEGFGGAELLAEFKKRRKEVRPAVEHFLKEAENAAHGDGESYSYDDIFGSEDNK